MLNEIGIKNIELICADISQFDFKNMKFDYIICHGIFSWVNQNIQNAILEIIEKHLSPNGVAFISYNTYPGWHTKELAKNLMLFCTEAKETPIIRTEQALKMLKFTQAIFKKSKLSRTMELNTLFKMIIESPKYYVTHEFFEDNNIPLYFLQFIEKLSKYNLAYVNDSNRIDYWRVNSLLDREEYENISNYFGYNLEKIEQYFDFLDNRAFRRSIITHRNNLVENNNDIRELNKLYQFNKLYFSVNVKYIEETEDNYAYWQIIDSQYQFISRPISDHIFQYISSKGKELCSISEIKQFLANKLAEYNEQEINSILQAIIYSHNAYISFSNTPLNKYNEKPQANEKYRKLLQFIEKNPDITSLSTHLYESINFSSFVRYIFKHCDGSKTITDMINLVKEDINKGIISVSKKENIFDIEKLSVEKEVLNALDILYKNGFFNHY